jgi:hypothetical protein
VLLSGAAKQGKVAQAYLFLSSVGRLALDIGEPHSDGRPSSEHATTPSW